MSIFLAKILTKLYWPTVGLYGVILVIFSIMYFTEMHNWTNRSYYNWMNFKRVVIPAIFLGASLIAKYHENQKIANILIYIPIGFIILILIGGLLIAFMYTLGNR